MEKPKLHGPTPPGVKKIVEEVKVEAPELKKPMPKIILKPKDEVEVVEKELVKPTITPKSTITPKINSAPVKPAISVEPADDGLVIVDVDSTNSQKKLSIGLSGISGSGKTTTSLMWAEITLLEYYPELKKKAKLNEFGNIGAVPPEISKKIGIVDTEHGRSSNSINQDLIMEHYGSYKTGGARVVYIDSGKADAGTLVKAKNKLIAAGCEFIIIDSLSHAWDSVLETHSAISNGNNNYTSWSDKNITASLRSLKENLIVDENVHVISCMRAKKETNIFEKNAGKIGIVNNSVSPKMKEDITYEFQVLLLLQADHTANIVKDNTGLFVEGMNITPKAIEYVSKWLNNTLDRREANIFVWDQLENLDKNNNNKMIEIKTGYLKSLKKPTQTKFADLDIGIQLGILEAIKDDLFRGKPYVYISEVV